MAPPAKRRKRTIVQTSSDEEDASPPANTLANYLFSSPDAKNTSNPDSPRAITLSPSPVRKSSRLAAAQSSNPPLKPFQLDSLNSSVEKGSRKSTTSSPGKSRTKPSAKVKSEEKGKSGDIVSLFSKQAERGTTRVPVVVLDDDISSDPISDDDDDDVGEHRATTPSHVGPTARRRVKELNAGGSNTSAATATTQRFLKPALPLRNRTVSDDEQRPWSEMFGPVNLDELAVHKRKVADVRKWLEDVMAGRMRQRLLILKGAAGTGKTTTLRLLAKDMRCEVLEWRNPTAAYDGSLGFQSASAQFEEFMGRGGKFSQLDTNQEDAAPGSNEMSNSSRKILLIEEFPNTFARSSTALASFRKAVLQYLATNTPSLSVFTQRATGDSITPVVMIISETLLTTTSAYADSFTVHRLLGPEILRHPGTGIIEFNAIAPTLLAAALELIVQKEARKSGRRRTPGPLVLKKLGEIGDIRSAISALQFLCLKGDADADWGSQVSFGKPKRSLKSNVSLTPGEVETLQLVSQREASLGIFHAVGKVVYNRRDESPADPRTPEGRAELLPGHLASYSRPLKSEVSVDTLIDETGTDTHTFISALHENYVLSCEPPSYSDPNSFLDYMGGCMDQLSDSDLLCPSRDVFFDTRGGSALSYSGKDSASHVLRQEEIAFQVATRGLLFSLPNPVTRKATAGSKRSGGDAFKMFYPTSLKLWREKEELESLVDHWSSVLLRGEDNEHDVTDGASAFRRPRNTDTNQTFGNQIAQQNKIKTSEQTQNQSSAALLSLGSSARREMLLERLPYMLHLARRRRMTGIPIRLKEIERIVSYSGIGGWATDENEVDLDETSGAGAGEAWATDRPTEEMSPRRKSFGLRQSSHTGSSGSSIQVQKLVLSDDDIEDD